MKSIKFHLLKAGQQFTYRGENYTKVSPLIASNNADGKQKMIPRSAVVEVEQPAAAGNTTVAAQAHPALEVIERYHQTALAQLQSLSDDESKLGAARSRLEALKTELEQVVGRQ